MDPLSLWLGVCIGALGAVLAFVPFFLIEQRKGNATDARRALVKVRADYQRLKRVESHARRLSHHAHRQAALAQMWKALDVALDPPADHAPRP